MLAWSELEEGLFDVEVNLNNRQLTLIEEGLKYLLLTPNSLIFGRDISPDDSPEDEEISDNWNKRQICT